jgi:hypothetical protein
MGNYFAYGVLFCWPLLSLYFLKSKSIQSAVILIILGGFLFLPLKTSLDLPLLPAFDKYTVPILTLLVASLFLRKVDFKIFSSCRITNFFVVAIVVTPIFTMLNNPEPVISGSRYIRGLSYHEAFSYSMYQFLFIATFFLGRRYFRTLEQQLFLLKSITVFALIYSLLILFELRMSPSLHSSIYGFFPHSYQQALRDGGYRPVVFLGHGLMVSFYIAASVICVTIFLKNKIKINLPVLRGTSAKPVSIYLVLILFLSKSLAPFLYAIFSLMCSLLFKAKRITMIAIMIGFVALSYPAAKMLGLFPSDLIVSLAKEFAGDERALSMQVRFDNEDIIVDKARQKIWFGWGGWGRSRVFDENGQDISITDGFWAIELGSSGLIGFIGMFGLMFISILKANKALKITGDKQSQNALALHALLVAFIMIDQLPNSSLVSFWWLVIGALVGRSEFLLKNSNEENQKAVRV